MKNNISDTEDVNNPYEDPEKILAWKVSKKLHLDMLETNMLIKDLYNLRGYEWLNYVEETNDKELIEEFKKFIEYGDEDDEDEEEDFDGSINETILEGIRRLQLEDFDDDDDD